MEHYQSSIRKSPNNPIITKEELMNKVRAAFNLLEPSYIRNATRSVINHVNKRLEVNGSNYEDLS